MKKEGKNYSFWKSTYYDKHIFRHHIFWNFKIITIFLNLMVYFH